MRVNETSIVFAALLLNAAGAYSLFGVPVPWLAAPLLVSYLLVTGPVLLERRLWSVLLPLVILAGLAIVTTVHTWPASTLMPALATTNYLGFLVSRYAALAVYIVGIIVFCRFTARRGELALCNLLIWIGLIVSGYAFFTYAAQLIGFWEIPRTRMGTGGQDFTVEAIEFQYAFHRALGSFREPSHLAEWLIVPTVAALGVKSRRAVISQLIMLSAIVLSGSFMAVIALAGAWLALGFIGLCGAKSTWRAMLGASVSAAIVVYLIDAALGLGFIRTIESRIAEALIFGVEGTNRNYIYRYVSENPLPAFGYGLGNASLKLTDALGVDLISSHLSLYLHYLYALGVLGVALLAWHFGVPLVLAVRFGLRNLSFAAQALVAGHAAWLLMYAGHSEEPALMHAVAIGGFLALVSRARSRATIILTGQQQLR